MTILKNYSSFKNRLPKKIFSSFVLALFLVNTPLFLSYSAEPQKSNDLLSNNELLSQYVRSKGKDIIVFDASNIKQYWIDNSVSSRNELINIILKNNINKDFESVPMRIQLINVNETQDCNIEVISDSNDYFFSVLNNKSKVLSSSQKENELLDYSIMSSSFHLEDTQNLTFDLIFSSKKATILSIKKIILSFSANSNSSFCLSPGVLHLTKDNISTSSTIEEKNKSFSLTGGKSILSLKNKILLSDAPLNASLTIQNTGTQATTVYFGFSCYSKTGEWINGKNFPFKNINKTLNVISATKGNTKIIVDKYPDWSKNCHLCIDAKDDMSDVPNATLADGNIIEVNKINDNQAEIILDKPLKDGLKENTKVRIHGFTGAHLYTNTKVLNPGEEITFNSTIKKDEDFLQYSSKAFARGVYYVVPIIISYSTDSNKDNAILIRDFELSY